MSPFRGGAKVRPKQLLVGILAVFGMLYVVCAYGSSANTHFGNFREISGWVTLFVSVVAILFLPGRAWRVELGKIPLVSIGGILLLGLFMVWNAVADHSLKTFQYIDIGTAPLAFLRGSMARSSSIRAVLEFCAVSVAVVAFAKACKTSMWMKWLMISAGTGLFVMLIGIGHKAFGLESIWGISEKVPPTYYAPYVYNANAGAFMNLAFPVAFAFGVDYKQKSKNLSALWFLVAGALFGGLLATASKGTIALAFLSLGLQLFVHWHHLKIKAVQGKPVTSRSFEKIFFVMLAGIFFLAILGFGARNSVERWGEFIDSSFNKGGSGTLIGRMRVMGVLIEMVKPNEGGFFGFGPGTFPHLLPYFTADMGDYIRGRWDHAHCDILQTVIEWGYIGGAMWFTFGVGAFVCGVLMIRRKMLHLKERALVRGMLVALAITALHTVFDFPLSIYSIHVVAVSYCAILWGLFHRKMTTGVSTEERDALQKNSA